MKIKYGEKIPNCKVKYQEHGSDPRNYKVNFNKVKSTFFFDRWLQDLAES